MRDGGCPCAISYGECQSMVSPTISSVRAPAFQSTERCQAPEKLFAFSFHDGTTGQSTSSGAALRMKARTQIGRVTIAVLAINDPEVVNVRRALQDDGVFWSKELIRPAPNAGI